ncbi:class I SAM-dependent methyltransferase [Chloroflexi bacterium TSY]|nr:class I SAM-dependent methyltransferase [Chloroflexi bacterium TSY]
MALSLAPDCRSILAYDRIPDWIESAQQAARDRGLSNLTFVCHDSSSDANGGKPRLPAEDNSFNLLICSKGPFHWILDAPRVARSGATMLMLVPDGVPLTPWRSQLPTAFQWKPPPDHWARTSIEERLEEAGLTLHSWWSFDVPEVFSDPEQLYVWLAWGYTPDEVPTLEEIRPTLERIFVEYGGSEGVVI